MRKILCKIGIHKWSGKKYKGGWKWLQYSPINEYSWKRRCKRCRVIQIAINKAGYPKLK